ncbi:MAG: hypothetical protein RL522_1072 [Pseudomonadota bacterium]|jgi:hypothetical protein
MPSVSWQRSDGELLKALREQAGLDPVVLARMGTMTVHQLRGLEEGEGGEFYSPEIKAHMGRTLLARLGHVPPPTRAREEAVIAAPAPAPHPEPQPSVATEIPASSLRRIWPRRGRLVAIACALGVLTLGAYALVRSASMRPSDAAAPVAVSSPAVPAAPSQSAPSQSAPSQSAPVASAAPDLAAPAAEAACNVDPAAPTLAYRPGEPRKAGNFVYLVADKPARLCVQDAVRKATRIDLETGASRSVYGQAPFVVQGDLSHLRIFFQGVRVQGELAVGTQVVLNEAPLR